MSTTPASTFRQIVPVALILGGILSFVFGIVCLRYAFALFDLDMDFWVWFGRAIGAFLIGVAGLHFGTQRLGLK